MKISLKHRSKLHVYRMISFIGLWISAVQIFADPKNLHRFDGQVFCIQRIQNVTYVCTEKGGYVSHPQKKWLKIANGLPQSMIINFYSFDDEIYSATSEGLYILEKGGDVWKKKGSHPQILTTSFYKDGQNLYIGSENAVYHSKDDGKKWEPMHSDLLKSVVTSISKYKSGILIGTDGNEILEIKYNSSNVTKFFLQTPDTNITALDNKNNLVVGTRKGLYLLNESNWERLDKFENFQAVRSLAISNQMIFAGLFNGELWSSMNFGKNWKKVFKNPDDDPGRNTISAIFILKNKIFFGTAGGEIWTDTITEQKK